MDVIEVDWLPTQETRLASCLESKKEVKICTGGFINAMKMENRLFVSKKVFKILSKV